MPVNQERMQALKKRYGAKGERVYYALENMAKHHQAPKDAKAVGKKTAKDS